MTQLAPNVDHELECAMAAEAVYAYERYMPLGISPADFSSAALQGVVAAAAEAWEVDGAVNLETTAKALQRAGKLGALGGAEGLAHLLASPAVVDHERFVELRRLRLLREAALRIVLESERGDLQAALSALGEAQTNAIESGRNTHAVDGFEMGLALLKAIQELRQSASLVHPGLELLQRAAGDLPLRSLTVLGGGTNTGKSSVALEMLIKASARNVTCGYVSCEDPETVVSARLLSVYTGLSSRKLAMGNITTREEWEQLTSGYGPLEKLRGKLWFSFAVGGTEIDVCASMSRLAARGSRLIVVDYVQAIDSSKRQQDRRNEIRWLCARLKSHADRLNVALVLVSQLGRPPKGDEQREPTKHDLKEAGDLENAAEFVVLIWREREDDFEPVKIKLAKSKFGNIGATWQMVRNARSARLEEDMDSYESAAKKRQGGFQ